MALTVFVCTSYMTYFTLRFDGQSVLSVAYGYLIEKETAQSHLILTMAIVTPFWCFYLFSAYWTCVIYYTLIQYLLKELARNSFGMVQEVRRMMKRRMIERRMVEGKDVFQEILTRFKLYNDLVDDVNDSLSVIPFVTLADDFVMIILVICFIVIYDTYLTVSFVVFTFGFMIAFKLTLLHFSIKVACDSYDQMKQVRKETVIILSTTSCDRDESWSNLSLFLSKESISKATVWNLFKMKRTILLSFAESIIPFAVMIITTCIEFKTARKVV